MGTRVFLLGMIWVWWMLFVWGGGVFGQGFLPFEGVVGWLRNLCIYSRITLSVNISVRQNDVEHGVCFTGLFQLLYVRTRLCSSGCAVICDTTRP